MKINGYATQDSSRMGFFNINLKNLVVFLMNVYAIQLCLFLIFVIELSDIFSKVRYLLRYSIILSLVFFISVDGEKVTSEGEKLRKALWMCSWTDKPNWFKKSLLTMMTRATVDLKIRPFTLYSLDLTCFTQIVKGTYSYFNIYKSLKK
ncbi:odorant receptor 2a isoform X3 [Nilaparvata lugens]|uniref:odorant receptor 2a isoform X3 n=2 Tax=Nilaparvata lugens TaxID=108931 RepID=UPI00193CC726|nr:odorant receptor 2a isoform X3 [Nilaparvata lugens]